MRKKYKKTSSSKYYNGYIDFSNKKDPIIVCDKINHTIKLKSPIINYLHDDFVEFASSRLECTFQTWGPRFPFSSIPKCHPCT